MDHRDLGARRSARMRTGGTMSTDDRSPADTPTTARAVPQTSRRRVQKHGRVVVVDVDRDALWEIVRDPTRVGEWSHECNGATWLDDATAAVPGARFRGRNRQRIFRWGRVCEVVSVDPHQIVWRTVPTKRYPDS